MAKYNLTMTIREDGHAFRANGDSFGELFADLFREIDEKTGSNLEEFGRETVLNAALEAWLSTDGEAEYYDFSDPENAFDLKIDGRAGITRMFPFPHNDGGELLDANIGAAIASLFSLPEARDEGGKRYQPRRFDTEHGNKTDVGLARTVRGIMADTARNLFAGKAARP